MRLFAWEQGRQNAMSLLIVSTTSQLGLHMMQSFIILARQWCIPSWWETKNERMQGCSRFESMHSACTKPHKSHKICWLRCLHSRIFQKSILHCSIMHPGILTYKYEICVKVISSIRRRRHGVQTCARAAGGEWFCVTVAKPYMMSLEVPLQLLSLFTK